MPTLFQQSFERNEDGITEGGRYGNVEIVSVGSAGYEGIPTSGSGNQFAIMTQVGDGPFTNFGGYRTEFIDGLTAEVRVYFDEEWADRESFQYSVAANGTDGIFQRDFVFEVQSNGDGTFSVAGSTMSTEPLPDGLLNATIVETGGWYTLQHVFNDDEGVLSVAMNLIDDDGNVIPIETIRELDDTIGEGGEVGGNRYGWFTNISVEEGIAVDNITLASPSTGGGGGGGGTVVPPSGETTTGTSGSDSITGTAGNDTVLAGDGDDFVLGGAGDDQILGGGGDDTMAGGEGNDEAFGGEGNDAIAGGAGNDTLGGGEGSDQLFGAEDDDAVYGGDDNDLAYGGSGNDDVYGGSGADTLAGGEGDDEIGLGIGDDEVAAGAGNDTVYGADGNDTIFAVEGADSVFGGSGDDVIYLGNSGGTPGDGAQDVYNSSADNGDDIVYGFEDGTDLLNLTGSGFGSFDDLSSRIGEDADGNVTIDLGNDDVLTLIGVRAADIDQSDFQF